MSLRSRHRAQNRRAAAQEMGPVSEPGGGHGGARGAEVQVGGVEMRGRGSVLKPPPLVGSPQPGDCSLTSADRASREEVTTAKCHCVSTSLLRAPACLPEPSPAGGERRWRGRGCGRALGPARSTEVETRSASRPHDPARRCLPRRPHLPLTSTRRSSHSEVPALTLPRPRHRNPFLHPSGVGHSRRPPRQSRPGPRGPGRGTCPSATVARGGARAFAWPSTLMPIALVLLPPNVR